DQNSEGEPEKTGDGQPRASDSQQARSESSAIEGERRPGKKGHGRRAASDYSGAKVVNCRHEDLKPGDACPAHLCGGRLYDLNDPKGLLQFTGQPLITVTRFKVKLRWAGLTHQNGCQTNVIIWWCLSLNFQADPVFSPGSVLV